MGSNTRILTPNIVNEARFGYSRFYNAVTTLTAFKLNTVGALNLPNLAPGDPVAWGIPNINLVGDGFNAGGYSFGDSTEAPYENQNNTAQFIDNVSWKRKSIRRAGTRVARTSNPQEIRPGNAVIGSRDR
jgi:hypothetical protein